ncbi:MAG: hypothetical protein AMXMBFR6_21700 [Betaproteobacteria bacterium]|jgi:hypothetical protein|nr:DUF3619 family protein [Rhodocyclaceae bacterium]MCG3186892.1 hypothetical protein [Rhodocyclaceae bacterium]
MIDERELGRHIADLLDQSCRSLPAGIADRLFLARQRALRHYGRRAAGEYRGFSLLPGNGPVSAALRRNALGSLLLVAFLSLTWYWHEREQLSRIEEVDSALLADELPLDAYLDRGFFNWLSSESGEP